jgi:hypothetical protein
MTTASVTAPRRRAVRRRARPSLDTAYDTALSELPPELRVALQIWVEARRAEWAARAALSTLMTRHNYRWREIDRIARQLT